MGSDLIIDKEYKSWLSDIKLKVRNVQIKAALKVQTELLNFYWDLGADIVAKQTHARWGDGLIEQLSKDLMAEFPDIKGFSRSNLDSCVRTPFVLMKGLWIHNTWCLFDHVNPAYSRHNSAGGVLTQESILSISKNGICFIVQSPFQAKLRNKLFRN